MPVSIARTLVAAAILACTLVVASPVASGAASPPAQLQRLLDSGRTSFLAGQYLAALQRYEEAFALSSWENIQYMIGRCHEKLGRSEAALAAFERALKADDLPEDARAVALAAVGELEGQLRWGALVLQARPMGARVFIDGIEVGRAPIELAEISAGSYEIRVVADGHEAATRNVTLAAGQRALVEVDLALSPAAAAVDDGPLLPPPLSPAPQLKRSYSPWTWITLGTGVALVGGGTASFLLGDADHTRLHDHLGGPADITRSAARSLQDQGNQKKVAGYAMWGAGGAVLVVSISLFIAEAAAPALTTGIVDVTAGVAPTPAGAVWSVQGRF